MKKLCLFFALIIVGSFFVACGKSGSSSAIDIRGFKLTDYSGSPLGQSGPVDSDWTSMAKLSAAEMALFDFGDTVSLDNTNISNVNISAYPNPAYIQQLIHAGTGYHAVVKLVIVNKDLKVLFRTAVKTAIGGQNIVLDLSDRAKFPDHSSVRIYYSFSAEDHPNFMVGYGDTRICSSTAVDDCF